MSHPFRQAVEARDFDAVAGLFAPDAVLNSPVAFKPFQGKDQVLAVLEAVSQTFEDFEYTDELAGEGVHALIFQARVGEKRVQGMDLIRHDENGKIADITVMVRPASALMALGEAMGPKVAGLAK